MTPLIQRRTEATKPHIQLIQPILFIAITHFLLSNILYHYLAKNIDRGSSA